MKYKSYSVDTVDVLSSEEELEVDNGSMVIPTEHGKLELTRAEFVRIVDNAPGSWLRQLGADVNDGSH